MIHLVIMRCQNPNLRKSKIDLKMMKKWIVTRTDLIKSRSPTEITATFARTVAT